MREGAGDGIRGGALLCGGLGYVVPMIGRTRRSWVFLALPDNIQSFLVFQIPHSSSSSQEHDRTPDSAHDAKRVGDLHLPS